MNSKGITVRPSPYTVKETIDRLQEYLLQHGARMYTRIDQQNESYIAGINLFPIEFILFGNPQAGGPVMSKNPLTALDLPLKIIVYEDGKGNVLIAYNEALCIEERYSLLHSEKSPFDLNQIVESAIFKLATP